MPPLRWGIAATGKISTQFVTALLTLPREEHEIVAVAARSLENAKQFADLHGIPKAYQGYDGLVKDPTIDIIYVGAIHPVHFDIARLALEGGKHVLCEKPLCMNEKQAKRLIDIARERKVFLMEAIWSRFFPAYAYLKNRLKNGDLGEIKEVNVEFGTVLSGVTRIQKKELGGGALLDIGIYTIQVILWAVNADPAEIKATGKLNEEGVDLEMDAVLKFPNGAQAKIKTSVLEVYKNEATIIGTKGQITLHCRFWSPTSLTDIDGSVKEWPMENVKHGLRFEAEEARRCILAGLLESSSVSHEDSMRLARIEDELRRQMGVKYAQDDE